MSWRFSMVQARKYSNSLIHVQHSSATGFVAVYSVSLH